ncbi:hypothetical protein ECP02989428_5037, partial [Escherichia coli P0298942.8]
MCNPEGRIRRGKRRIRQLHRATGGCGVLIQLRNI